MDHRTLNTELLKLQRNLSHPMHEYIHAARKMTYMAKAIDLTFESIYEGAPLQRSIWRYEALWLPILAAVSQSPNSSNSSEYDTLKWSQHAFASRVEEIRSKNFAKGGLCLNRAILVPPLDIAWIWHCHRLNPHAYAEDLARFAQDAHPQTVAFMIQACSTTIETAFKFSDGEDSQSRLTRRLWEITYPYESYLPQYLLNHTYEEEETKKRQHITSYTNEITRAAFRSVLWHDIAREVSLQRSFVFQIIDDKDPDKEEYYETNSFLTRAFRRYMQFILLHKNTSELLIPMKDINIIWHAHLSCTTEYTHDCKAIVGSVVRHDSLAVDDSRQREIQNLEAEQSAQGAAQKKVKDHNELQLRRQRGVSITRTKHMWKLAYGNKTRYDLPDTRYEGVPPGNRGGFKSIFERTNGTSRDISWLETLCYMVLAAVVFVNGSVLLLHAFYKAMLVHGKYLLGLPLGVGIMILGIYIFLAIPISRPLSSDSRYWLQRSHKQSHNPLPPYLISSSKKSL